MATFNIKHGGIIRKSAGVAASQTWSKGRILTLNSSGVFATSTGAQLALAGLAMENTVSATAVGPTVTLTKVGAPSGAVYSAVLDEAVVVTDQLQSGVSWNPGDVCYISTTGYITTSGNSTGPNNMKCGIALTSAASNDTFRPLEFFFTVAY